MLENRVIIACRKDVIEDAQKAIAIHSTVNAAFALFVAVLVTKRKMVDVSAFPALLKIVVKICRKIRA